ncbi:MAG TPA: M3 family metallopeptidase, partial [Myxococcales bacterium]|nr:M3 family metallopeptidase [Myxococcales bacterium]
MADEHGHDDLVPDAARWVTCSTAELKAATDRALESCRGRIQELRQLTRPIAGERALARYDEAIALLTDTSARASVVRNAHPDKAMRDLAESCEQELEKESTDISLDRGVFEVLERLDVSHLDAATKHYHHRILRDFRRAGVNKDQATRDRIRALQEELVRIGQEFGRNILEDVRHVDLDPSDLDGLPEDYRRSHPPGEGGKVRVTTDYPDSLPFMTYARSGRAREALWRVSRLRGYPKNQEVLDRLIRKRAELAEALGYPTWAAYATEDKMIKTQQAAADFIEKISRIAEPRMKADYQALLERKRKEDPAAAEVSPWDQAYLEDRLKAERYQFDSQSVRPFFEYGRVKQGVLDLTARLFGVSYRKVEDAPRWHPDVEAYDVLEGGRLLGRFYLDMHPREGKYKHAAQFTLATGKEGRQLPEGVLMCNFPRPGDQPALMQHSDVETFLHEFGHLLHHIFGGHTRWAGLSGVRTEWDFVEAPSQMLEEWAWDAQALQTFARHHQTGEPIPADVVKRMKAADEFGKGLYVRQQMFYAAVSLACYSRDPAALDPTALM